MSETPESHRFPRGRLTDLMLATPVRRNHLEQADPAQLSRDLLDPRARVLLLRGGTAPIRRTPETACLDWRGPEELTPLTRQEAPATQSPEVPEGLIHLGHDAAGRPLLLRHLPEDSAGDPAERPAERPPQDQTEHPEDPQAEHPAPAWEGLREAAPDLEPEEATWFATALALAHFHREHRHCPGCGAPTVPALLGWARRCPQEGREIFPRTDPAIIVAVTHTGSAGCERILLGNSARWPAGRFSTFAGFVEAGESLEAAVTREVAEEAGVVVEDPVYRGSQPWPFPRSLMLGFRAHTRTPEAARADGEEISQVRWFTREQLREAVRSEGLQLPGKVSIAHHLIREWYGAPLPEPTKG